MSGKIGKKAPLPSQYKTYAAWIKDLFQHGKTSAEVRQITGCSKSYVWRYKPAEPSEEKPEPSEIEIEEVREEISEIPLFKAAPAAPVPAAKKEEIPEDVEIFRNMMRGLYTLLCSDEGVLGKEYGRPKDACIEIADQTYRYVARRVKTEDLEQYDTYLLIVSHIAFLVPSAWKFVKKRQAEAAARKEKESREVE